MYTNLYIYMYVYIYIYTSIHIYVHTYTLTHLHIYTHTRTHARAYIQWHTYIHACRLVWLHVFVSFIIIFTSPPPFPTPPISSLVRMPVQVRIYRCRRWPLRGLWCWKIQRGARLCNLRRLFARTIFCCVSSSTFGTILFTTCSCLHFKIRHAATVC